MVFRLQAVVGCLNVHSTNAYNSYRSGSDALLRYIYTIHKQDELAASSPGDRNDIVEIYQRSS